jgi:UDP-glucuronate 4-epimerase
MKAADERFLVTGALGCIGAWTVRRLVQEGKAVVAFDLGTDARRLRQLMSDDELGRVTFMVGDISDFDAVSGALDEHRITNVIHLAALQVPFCRADPVGGAMVNVVGTVNVFEAVMRRAHEMAPVVYTSSIAIYGPDDADPATGRLATDARAHPGTLYGVYKLANEGTAQIYWLDHELPSVGLRPMTVYGVGRDQGMTSGPTKAIVAAVAGQPYTVPFDGTTLYQYADDVAQALIAASRSGLPGAHVFNLPGAVASGGELLAALAASVPGAADLIRFEPVELPFPSAIDHNGIEALGALQLTPFDYGIGASVEIYRRLADEGRLVPEDHGLEPATAA